eukprot:INCI13910.2.p1 GENE.INCI13910.2~~INCI13910.2.p1  ORF type:complete len:177 (+),score=20.39 INCI13910.2:138-668(+)
MGCLWSLFGSSGSESAQVESKPSSAQQLRIGSKFRGTSVKVESGNVVSGSGAVVANVPLHQDRAYWEVTIVDLPEGSNFALGVAKQQTVQTGGTDANGKKEVSSSALYEKPLGTNPQMSWGIGRQSLEAAKPELKAGDTIGVVYDQGTGAPCVELFHKVANAQFNLHGYGLVEPRL